MSEGGPIMAYPYMIEPPTAPGDSPAYVAMLDHARGALAGRSASQIAGAAGVAFDEAASAFLFDSLGQRLAVHWPGCLVTFAGTEAAPLRFWTLAALHYLHAADDAPLSGEWITFRMLPGGAVRGGNFDRECSRTLAQSLGAGPLGRAEAACLALGATLEQTSADLTARFWAFPRYPILLKLWRADEELPGSGQLLLDSRAHHYLSMEHAATLGFLLLDLLRAQYEATPPG